MMQPKRQTSDLPKTSAPAQRALDSAGITTLEQLSTFKQSEIAKFHGMGPKAIGILREALAAKGLTFADEPVAKAAKGYYAKVNGLTLYYEIHGAASKEHQPLVLLHGGLGLIEMLSEVLITLSKDRQVIGVDLQGHGRTADSERPLRYEFMADDIAVLLHHLGITHADVMGYSLGAGAALRTAIQYPDLVRKLVVVSAPCKRTGWYPEVLVGMAQLSGAAAEFMKESSMYQSYRRVAPKPENFPLLLDKVGDLLRQPYDWSSEVAELKMPVMLVFADADSVPPSHSAEFFGLLGGGQRDADWDGSGITQHRLAILPGLTHYNVFASPLVSTIVVPFLNASLPRK